MFKSYIEAVKIVEDIAFDYNWTINDQFINTKYDVCKNYNITMSTFNRLQYNFPDLFRSHAYFRGQTRYNTLEQLKIQDIEAIAAMYNNEVCGRRVNSNELICERYSICIHTLYYLIRHYPKLFKRKRYIPNPIIDGKLKCAKCGRIFDLDFYHKDKNAKRGIRNICKLCANQRQNELKRSKRYANNNTKK